MANTSISNLSAGAAVAAGDLFPDVQTVGVGPVKVTAAQLKTFVSASPTLVTPTLGVAAGTSLALGGATIGSNALALTGTANISSTVTSTSALAIGTGQATASFDTAGALGGSILLGDSGAGANNGGAVVFAGNSQTWRFAAIKGLITNGSNNSQGDLVISTRRVSTDAALTEAIRVKADGSLTISNTVNSVSPTSPNRTVTMVINGTTYYLHAKTTND